MFHPFPRPETERLSLRRLTVADAADVFLMRSDPEVMQYIPRPLATTVADAAELIDKLNGFADQGVAINWAVEWKETGTVIGIIGYVHIKTDHHRAEVGYSLTRSWHRKGIMREALQRVLQYGFQDMKLHSIEAITDADNQASGALLLAAGFRQEAFFREDFLYNGVFRDSIHYGLLKTEF